MRRLLSFLWMSLLASSLAFSFPASSSAAGQAEKRQIVRKKKKTQPEKEKKKEKPLLDELEELKEADYPDLVPADEKGELADEFDELGEADYPDLVGVDEEGGIIDEFALLEEEISADEVESASKHRQSIFWSPSAVNVYTKDDIQNAGVITLADFMRRVPGFDVYELKPSYPVIGARGLTDDSNNLVLVLVDGREALAEFTGDTLWNALPFDMEEIERIEVIRGPGSALYGANAFSAVVNITTVTSKPGGADVFIAGGEQGHYRLLGRVRDNFRLGKGTLSYSASLGAEGIHSTSDRRDRLMELYRPYGWLRYQKDALDLMLLGGLMIGNGMFCTHVGDMAYSEGVHSWAMAKAELGIGETTRLKAQLYYSSWKGVFHSRINFQAFDIWIADIPDFLLDFPTVDGQVQLDFPIRDNLLLIGGANLRYIYLYSDNYTPSELDETRGAGFVQAMWRPWETFQLTAGVRLDLSTEIEPTLSPRAAVVFRPWPNHAFRLSYGLAFRKPSLFESQVHVKIERYNQATPEIADKMATAVGNENLTNEKVQSLEAGWRASFQDDRLRASVDLFLNIYQDLIFFNRGLTTRMGLPDIENSILMYENEDDRIVAVGGEVELVWQPAGSWAFWGNLGLRRVSDLDSGESPATEEQLRANLGLRYFSGSGPLADLSLHYVSSYTLPLTDPYNILNEPEPYELGNNFLAIGRIGYRATLGEEQMLEAGMKVRAPLGLPFREYPGIPIQRTEQSVTVSDFGGERLVRLVSFYLWGSF